MSLLAINLSEVQDQQPVPAGEYRLELKKCNVKKSKKSDNHYINAMYIIEGEKDAPPVFDMVIIPDDSQEYKSLFERRMKDFYEAHGLPLDGSEVDLEAIEGNSIEAILSEEEASDDNEACNRIKRYILPA
jgi:hypothetical protein